MSAPKARGSETCDDHKSTTAILDVERIYRRTAGARLCIGSGCANRAATAASELAAEPVANPAAGNRRAEESVSVSGLSSLCGSPDQSTARQGAAALSGQADLGRVSDGRYGLPAAQHRVRH